MESKQFAHRALDLTQDKPLIFTAQSKHVFYYRMAIVKFVLERGGVPINPFMVFDYFVADTVERDLVREANNNLVKRCDELWVFGPISDGVMAEIVQAQSQGKKIRYFKIEKSQHIYECEGNKVEFEADVSATPL